MADVSVDSVDLLINVRISMTGKKNSVNKKEMMRKQMIQFDLIRLDMIQLK